MSRFPSIENRRKICVLCEGDEDVAYLNRLLELRVWNNVYSFTLINAKSASNIPARFQDLFQNDWYELVLVFCDTDKYPHREYLQIKKKVNAFLGKQKAADRLIIFANPCTMQIILSHFGEVHLTNQGKKTNASEIERLTGVKNYDAHKEQINELCRKIYLRSYSDMKRRISLINFPDTTSCSTNFSSFLELFEGDDVKWINAIQRYIKER